jgi:BirA family biotin operon repressor/biotin-[acetyl-CoA-carboxylase] ligase
VESALRHVKGKEGKKLNPAEAMVSLLIDSPGSYLSGESIARSLNCSRAAIWKRIRSLKKDGFVIQAHPKKGYCLFSLPDIPFPSVVKAGLKTSLFGQEVYYYPKIDSTNASARQLAEAGAKEGTLVITDEQLKGRGRLSRSWISPPKKDLLFTLVFRPDLKPLQVFRLTLLSSLAIAEAVERETGLKPRIKWPNDLYLENKKLCGILTELAGEQDRVSYCLLGIGININSDPSIYPEIRDIATSLSQCLKREVPRVQILKAILESMEENYHRLKKEGIAGLREEWNNRSFILGKKVVVSSDKTEEYGIAESIDEDGFLILRDEKGERKRILSGDVSLRLT